MDKVRASRIARPWEIGAGAKSLATYAEGLGLDVLVRTTPASWVLDSPTTFERLPLVLGVHGRSLDRGVMFRALWADGATLGASVVMKHARWAIVPEKRDRTRTPTKINPRAITGYGHDTLVYLGGPFPRRVGVTELRAVLAEAMADSTPTEGGS